VNFIRNAKERVCITSMRHSYDFLKSKLKEKGIEDPNAFFIDCISRSVFMGVDEVPDCAFMHIHAEMDDFIGNLSSKLRTLSDCKIFVFDSLSDLKKQWPSASDAATNFAKSLLPVLSGLGADSYFILHEEDKEGCPDQLKAAFDGIYTSFGKDKV
jgi:hypothetical protein